MRSVRVSGLYIPPGEILVGGSGELGRTQILPLFSFGSVEVACALELPVTMPANTSKVAAMRMVGFILALYSHAKQMQMTGKPEGILAKLALMGHCTPYLSSQQNCKFLHTALNRRLGNDYLAAGLSGSLRLAQECQIGPGTP
jgi:hypothetical protein